MRRDDVDEPRSAGVALLVLEDDEQVRADRHDLPRDEERHDSLRRHDERERGDEHREHRVRVPHRPVLALVSQVRRAERNAAGADEADRRDEYGGERIEREHPTAARDRGRHGDGDTGSRHEDRDGRGARR
jgi:hypothetical protein